MSMDRNTLVPTFPVEIAVRHICTQHRNLARVFNAMETHAGAIAEDTCSPTFILVGAMLHYIDIFSDRIHHPAEEKYLFTAMRKNGTPDHVTACAVDAHRTGAKKLATLQNAFNVCANHVSKHYSPFLELLPDYISFEFDHISYEENVVLPCALDTLPANDWAPIADAFRTHADPLFGAQPALEFTPLHRLLFPVVVSHKKTFE